MDWSPWVACFVLVATLIMLRVVGLSLCWSVAVVWSLWFARCGFAALVDRCGGRSLWFGCYESVAMSVSRYKSVTMG